MIRAAVLLAVCLAGVPARADDAPPPPPTARSCATVSADLARAREAGRLQDAVALYGEAGAAKTGCTPKALFCLGRSLAFAHVEAAYAAVGKGAETDAARLLAEGGHFGQPWPLLVGQGDAAGGEARITHDPKRWADASLAYQKAVSALDEPVLCPDEPPAPDADAEALILRKMALATLLASPAPLFHSKCAPCSLAVLAHGAIRPDHPRPLPITFEPGGATMTPAGALTAAALADCARAAKWTKLDISAHTDERGSTAVNRTVSTERIESLRRALRQAGFAGAVEGTPAGKAAPLRIDDPQGLTTAEIQRANRRIELRSTTGAPQLTCAREEGPAP